MGCISSSPCEIDGRSTRVTDLENRGRYEGPGSKEVEVRQKPNETCQNEQE